MDVSLSCQDPGLDVDAWQPRLVDLMRHLGLPDNTLLSLTFVDDEAIADLNSRYRERQGPTDVLSFPQQDFEGLDQAIARLGQQTPQPGGPPLLLGDIVVSMDTARRQAEEFGHGLDREVGFLLIHGLLHLLGEDHETADQDAQMREHQRQCLAYLGLSRAS